MDKKRLKQKVRDVTGSGALIKELVKLLGISERSVCSKTNGEQEFKPSEIDKMRTAYGLTADETVEIFIMQGERA